MFRALGAPDLLTPDIIKVFLTHTGANEPFQAMCAAAAAGAEKMEACKNDNFNTASYEEMVDEVITPDLVDHYRNVVHRLHDLALVLKSKDIRLTSSGVSLERIHQCMRLLKSFLLTLTKLLRMLLTGTPTHASTSDNSAKNRPG